MLNFLNVKKSRFGKILNSIKKLAVLLLIFLSNTLLVGCDNEPWNDPYPNENAKSNTLYRAFSEQPKHLDPARSYSEAEWPIIGQIYESPLQYHYLKRPYTLEPLTADGLPEIHYYDTAGKEISENVDANLVKYTDYIIRIKPGIFYQPHPAFAKDATGEYLYINLKPEELKQYHVLADFKQKGFRELIAEDYVYQIKRLADPKLSSPIFGLMSKYIVGLKKLRQELLQKNNHTTLQENTSFDNNSTTQIIDKNILRNIALEGASVLDAYTYRIRINGKYPPFIYWFAMPFFVPIPWEATAFYDQPGMKEHNITLDWYPVGTGPYQMTENNPNYRLTLIKNPSYRKAFYPSEGVDNDEITGLLQDRGHCIPFIDRVIFSLEKEDIPSWVKFLQGYYDLSGISSDDFNRAIRFAGNGVAEVSEELKKQHIRLQTSIGSNVFYWGFNMLDETVGGYSEKARILRKAIAESFNVSEFVNLFLNGRGTIANGPIPQEINGYEVQPERKIISYAEAKKMIATAGYKNLTLNFDTVITGNPDEIALHAWLQEQFEKLGINLVIRGSDYNRFQDKLKQGTAQFFFFGWNADYPDPENFLFLFYGPNSSAEYGGENSVNYRNPEYDKLFERMRSLNPGLERTAIIKQMLALLVKDIPWIWGFYPKSFVLYHEWVRVGKPSNIIHNNLKYAKINAEWRAKSLKEWNQPILWPLFLFLIVLLMLCIPACVIWWQSRHREWRSRD